MLLPYVDALTRRAARRMNSAGETSDGRKAIRRARQAAGGSGAADRARPLRRRRQAAGNARSLLRAQPLRACENPLDRHRGGTRAARRRMRCSPPTTCPGAMATEPIPMILPVLGIAAFRTQLCLARDEVSYAGQTVALVVADSRYVGRGRGRAGRRRLRSPARHQRLPRRAQARRARRSIPISPPISPPPSRWPMATSTPPSRARRMSSTRSSGCTAAAA